MYDCSQIDLCRSWCSFSRSRGPICCLTTKCYSINPLKIQTPINASKQQETRRQQKCKNTPTLMICFSHEQFCEFYGVIPHTGGSCHANSILYCANIRYQAQSPPISPTFHLTKNKVNRSDSIVVLSGLYYCFNLVLIVVAIILSSLVVNISRGRNGQRVPRWLSFVSVLFIHSLKSLSDQEWSRG